MWLALLFDVLSLGAQYMAQSSSESYVPSAAANGFLEQAAQAILMRYTSCPPYTMEALILYIRSCQLQHTERRLKEWLALGIVTRMSQRMGYHRDPTQYPGITSFEAEMRRRVWIYLSQLDLRFSYELGLVSVIGKLNWDLICPGNFHDADLHPDLLTLPPPRPHSELTNVTAAIQIGRLLPLFSAAIELDQTTTFEQVSRIDENLQRVRDELPVPLKLRPFDQSFADPPNLIMDRIRIEHLCQNIRCILYRRYLGSTLAGARRICVDAALVILGLQKSLYDARRSDGPLSTVSALQILDLIDSVMLASMVIGLELNASRTAAAQSIYSIEERYNMVQALEKSCFIWTTSMIAPAKARRTAHALERIVRTEQSIHSIAVDGATTSATTSTGMY
jgi:hypothetical protein